MRVNGRRGVFLIMFGLIHIGFGAAYTFPETTASTTRSVGFLAAVGIPVWVAGLPWIASGLAAVGASFRVPPGRDGWGFGWLIAVETAWVFVFFLSWVRGDHPRGYAWALIFAALTVATAVVSGMVSAKQVLREREVQ